MAALTAQQVSHLTTTQLGAIESDDLRALRTNQLAALTTDQVQALSTDQIARLSGRPYGSGAEDDVAMRVVADHARATTFSCVGLGACKASGTC